MLIVACRAVGKGSIATANRIGHNPPHPFGFPVCLVFQLVAERQGIDNWLTWKNSPERKSFESMLDIYQDGPAHYEEYVVGAPVHES